MIKLAAFADEIDPNIDVQIKHCKLNGVTHIELRSVNKINVLDLPTDLQNEIKKKVTEAGMGINCIGSPIGKVAIDKPWSEHLDRFKIAIERAQFFGAKLIRVFSYYPAGGQGKGSTAPMRDEVVKRFKEKVALLHGTDIIMVHENESGIFGEGVQHCAELMAAVNDKHLRTAFDFANFVQAKEKPLDNWPSLKPYTTHIHIKDAMLKDGSVVPAGEGDGQLEPILVDAYKSGYRAFLTLEPHLKVAGHSHGETGPELFKTAVDALKKILARNNIPIAAA